MALCAGALGSPQLLLKSGIGAPESLAKAQVPHKMYGPVWVPFLRVLLGLCRDTGKSNGNYYNILGLPKSGSHWFRVGMKEWIRKWKLL